MNYQARIIRDPKICGGEPVIKGTCTPVRAIVEHWKFGAAPEEIARKLPHLRLAQIFDALGYYDDHREEIEKFIALNLVDHLLSDAFGSEYRP